MNTPNPTEDEYEWMCIANFTLIIFAAKFSNSFAFSSSFFLFNFSSPKVKDDIWAFVELNVIITCPPPF